MKKLILLLLTVSLIPFMFSCKKDNTQKETENENESESENMQSPTFVMRAVVTLVGEHIEVEVIESDYAFGVYWVLTSDSTEYTGKDGKKIKRTDINPGDTIEITYGGQVMMSYPPQISARAIRIA